MMAEIAMTDIAEKLKKIDFCMMSTKGSGQEISSRPMSNNGDVEYDGDNWFFSYRDTRKVADIGRAPGISLSFTEAPSLLGKPGMFISIEGKASLIDDKAQFQEHWTSELDRWFPDGVDTVGLTLIKVHADQIHYWDGEDNGTIKVG
jgi:general stress protein 26